MEPQTWIIYQMDPKHPAGNSFMHPKFLIEYDGCQEDLYRVLPAHPDGRSSYETWYPQVRQTAEKVKSLLDLKEASEALLGVFDE